MAEFFEGLKEYSHKQAPGLGVLLINLGTPDAPTKSALKRYLREFLSDTRVIELSRPLWWFILNAFILTTRPKKSAELYKKVWTESGSPLKLYTERQTAGLKSRLEKSLAERVVVEYAMRYGNPSVKSVLEKMRAQNINRLLILPLYPQYAGATAGSTFDAVVDALKRWRWIPEFRFISTYHDAPGYIKALASTVRELWSREGEAEKLVMSFHGVPKRYFLGGDPYYCFCQKTGRLLAEELGLSKDRYLVTFQSLFGKEEWLKPYTDETLKALGAGGLKSVDVICPGFTADCLETLEEINEQNREFFTHAGGGQFRYIPALNDRGDFIDFLEELVLKNIQGWLPENPLSEAELQENFKRGNENYGVL